MSALFHRVGALIGRRRIILRKLDGVRSRTVPQAARARPVSRQYVRRPANRLLGEGWVELADNPAHKRPRPVRPTPRGEGFVEEIGHRDAGLLGKPEIYVPKGDPRVAAGVLRSPRDTPCGERAEGRRRPGSEA